MFLLLEAHLGKRTALANSDDITDSNITEGRGDVCGKVLVTLLVTVVLGDEVEVVSSDDASPLHLEGLDHTAQDTATDLNIASEGALFVDELELTSLYAKVNGKRRGETEEEREGGGRKRGGRKEGEEEGEEKREERKGGETRREKRGEEIREEKRGKRDNKAV